MKRINSWQELEDFAAQLIDFDHPVKPKGSGSGKKEEDVVGRTLLIQCKYTDNSSISVSESDIARLKAAAKLLNKYPLIMTRINSGANITIPIDNDDTREDIYWMLQKIASSIHKNNLEEAIGNIKDIKEWNNLNYLLTAAISLDKMSRTTQDKIWSKFEGMLKQKYDDLTMHNLFEEIKND